MKVQQCVLIADVIHSSRQGKLRDVLEKRLREATRMHRREKRIRVPYAVTAGDEFQVVPTAIELIPELILDLRRRLRPLGLRIGIGIGGIQGTVKAPVNRLVGEAFARARRAMEEVKGGTLHKYPALTAFCSSRESFDRVVNLVYGLNDTLFLTITETQWRALEAYARHGSVDRTARALRLNRSTVSRNLKRGHYWQLGEVVAAMKDYFREEWS